jgi:hypothetical protein
VAAIRGSKIIYLTMLTLLSRVVATMDLSLPIILFSSSGQRVVTEECKGYGNIITAFEKPRFSGYQSEDMFQEAKAKWSAAIEQAADLLRARSAVQHICKESARALTRVGLNGDRKYLIELYLDETGNEFKGEEVKVGGLLLAGPKSRVLNFKRAVEKEVAATFKAAAGNLKTVLRIHTERLAKCIRESGKENGIHSSIVTLNGSLSTGASLEMQVGAVENELLADNLYRQMVSMIAEIAIYHFAAEVCEEGADATYGLYMATRGRSVLKPEDDNDAKELLDRWGIKTVHVGEKRRLWDAIEALDQLREEELDEVRKNLSSHAERKCATDSATYGRKRFISYVDFDAGRPIVQGISRHYRLAKFQPKAEHARAYLLDPRVFETRRIHLLTDALISVRETGEAMAHLVGSGIAGEYCLDLRRLLSGARQASNGFAGDGLATAALCARISRNADPNDIRRRLLRRLARFAVEMPGIEFMNMVNKIRSTKKVSEERPRVEKEGIVRKRRGSLCWIELRPDGHNVECRLPLRAAEGEIWLQRGDHVLVEVCGVNEPSAPGMDILKVLRWRRHLKWEKLSVGRMVTGRVAHKAKWSVRVDLDEIDAFVDFKDAPGWREATPQEGTKLQFKVIDINSKNGLLKLAPA